MKRDQVVEYIKQIWATNPLPNETEVVAPATIQGIQQQLDAGSKMIMYMVMEDGSKVLKTLKVEE
jgi:hypothetical protein